MLGCPYVTVCRWFVDEPVSCKSHVRNLRWSWYFDSARPAKNKRKQERGSGQGENSASRPRHPSKGWNRVLGSRGKSERHAMHEIAELSAQSRAKHKCSRLFVHERSTVQYGRARRRDAERGGGFEVSSWGANSVAAARARLVALTFRRKANTALIHARRVKPLVFLCSDVPDRVPLGCVSGISVL